MCHAAVKHLPDKGKVDFSYRPCRCKLYHLLGAVLLKRVALREHLLPSRKVLVTVLHHGIPCIHETSEQVLFKEVVASAAWNALFSVAGPALPHFYLLAQARPGAPPVHIPANPAEHAI